MTGRINLTGLPDATLRIAHDADFPPLTFVDGAESRGMVIDFLKEIFDRIGHSPAFVAVPLADHEEALRRGAADAVAFKATVPEFIAIYDFSAPLLTIGGAWFRPVGDTGTDLPAGARVVTPGRGPMLGVVRRDYSHFSLTAVESYAEALVAVADGAADAAALNFQIGGYLARRDHPESIAIPAAPFAPQPIGFCVLKGNNSELLSTFDRALEKTIGEGVRDRLGAHWLGEPGD